MRWSFSIFLRSVYHYAKVLRLLGVIRSPTTCKPHRESIWILRNASFLFGTIFFGLTGSLNRHAHAEQTENLRVMD